MQTAVYQKVSKYLRNYTDLYITYNFSFPSTERHPSVLIWNLMEPIDEEFNAKIRMELFDLYVKVLNLK